MARLIGGVPCGVDRIVDTPLGFLLGNAGPLRD
jgi:hypothetical protein